MAPPTPVYNRFEVTSKYSAMLSDPEKYHCQQKSLTQNECTFKLTYPNNVPKVICLPFKREFQRCLFPSSSKHNQGNETWINIEVTDENTNKNLFTDSKYKDLVQEFLQADKDLKQLLFEGQDNTTN